MENYAKWTYMLQSDDPQEPRSPSISVCVCTYRRPVQLAALIERLKAQQGPPPISELIIVDNDAAASARTVVEGARTHFPTRYEVQPIKNISLARNRSLDLARGDWIGFVDDDELPETDWLAQLHATAVRFAADGVMAPVLPLVPDTAPNWIRRGDFFVRPRHTTGTSVPDDELRTGNALIKASWLRRANGPFDPAYGLTGGGDSHLLKRLADAGARFVWCDEAAVTEPQGPERLHLGWVLRRAYRAGQGYARQTQESGYKSMGTFGRVRFVTRTAAAMFVSLLLTGASMPRGHEYWVSWLRKACEQAGKLTALLGHRYEEYR